MGFHRIDLENWPRREHYLHYLQESPCTYSITVELEVTGLAGQKIYPAMLWLLTDTVNELEPFRTHLSPEGLGVFDAMNPSYTVLNRENGRFCSIWTEFSPDYSVFLRRYLEDVARYAAAERFSPKPNKPDNCFDASMLPWVAFTSLNLNLDGGSRYLLPIFTMGKLFAREGKNWMPLAIQIHHSVCDGYHIGQFVERLQQKLNGWTESL